jgi:TraM recognition site of TraD and TraG
LISEIIQESRRLAAEREHHLTLAIDELKFMISQEISDALATIAGFNVNMILLHQSIKDLRSPEDRSLNVQALESGVLVNCQVKLMYRASDPDTAEWASKLSGTKIVRTTKTRRVEHNHFGGEKYQNERQVNDVEVAVISENEMLSLSPRVGVLFVPERLAAVLFTCFVSANLQRVLYKKPALPAPAVIALEDQAATKTDTVPNVARPPRLPAAAPAQTNTGKPGRHLAATAATKGTAAGAVDV